MSEAIGYLQPETHSFDLSQVGHALRTFARYAARSAAPLVLAASLAACGSSETSAPSDAPLGDYWQYLSDHCSQSRHNTGYVTYSYDNCKDPTIKSASNFVPCSSQACTGAYFSYPGPSQ